MTFLIIDGNEVRSAVLRSSIEGAKLVPHPLVLRTPSLQSALRRMQTGSFDFILLNCVGLPLPEVEIHQLRATTAGIPIVAIVSFESAIGEPDTTSLLQAGADDVIAASEIDRPLLQRVFRYIMSIRQAADTLSDANRLLLSLINNVLELEEAHSAGHLHAHVTPPVRTNELNLKQV